MENAALIQIVFLLIILTEKIDFNQVILSDSYSFYAIITAVVIFLVAIIFCVKKCYRSNHGFVLDLNSEQIIPPPSNMSTNPTIAIDTNNYQQRSYQQGFFNTNYNLNQQSAQSLSGYKSNDLPTYQQAVGDFEKTESEKK